MTTKQRVVGDAVVSIRRRIVMAMRSEIARRWKFAAFLEGWMNRSPVLQHLVVSVLAGDTQRRYQRWIDLYDTLTDADVRRLEQRTATAGSRLLFSLLIPVGRVDADGLCGLLESIRAQVFSDWEALFVGRPDDPKIAGLLSEAHAKGDRVKSMPAAGRATEDWQKALAAAEGEFVVFVDPASRPRRHALVAFADAVARYPDADVIYADEDVIDADGRRAKHYFKPDWSAALLTCQYYLGGFVCLRRAIAASTRGRPDEIGAEWGWSLFLRIANEIDRDKVCHLPFVLHHRLTRAASPREGTADGRDERRAIARVLEETGLRVEVEPAGRSSFLPRYALPDQPPDVTIVIPSTCRPATLRPCIEGLVRGTSYPRFQIVVVANGLGEDSERLEYAHELSRETNVIVVRDDERPYNFSRLNNRAVKRVESELVCFLNDDIEIIDDVWLAAMTARMSPDVGAVGAMLYYPNETIQHAGIILGVGGVGGHAYARRLRGDPGYHDRAAVDQDVSALTAACMLVRRGVFLQLGGFDESLEVSFNDIDLCLRMRAAGWRIVWTPAAELYHRESQSIGPHHLSVDAPAWSSAFERVRRRWSTQLLNDPYYNPNLSLDRFEAWEPGFPPRVVPPWAGDAERQGC